MIKMLNKDTTFLLKYCKPLWSQKTVKNVTAVSMQYLNWLIDACTDKLLFILQVLCVAPKLSKFMH